MDHLKAEFTQEALGNLEGEKDVKHVQRKLNKLWKKFVKVWMKYVKFQVMDQSLFK